MKNLLNPIKINLILLVFLGIVACQQNKKTRLPTCAVSKTEKLKQETLIRLNTKDTFLLRAIEYLFKNIGYQQFISGEQSKVYTDTILKYAGNEALLFEKIKILNHPYNNNSDSFLYDVLHCNATYLADNIRNVSKTFKQYKWNKSLDLAIFCNYLLPYKINQEQLENNWRQYFQDLYFSENDSSIFSCDIVKATEKIYKWLHGRKKNFRIFYGDKAIYFPDLSVEILERLSFGTCHEISSIGVGAMRAMGLPATIDFTPNYLNVNAGHEWASVVVGSKSCIPFDFTADSLYKIKRPFNVFAKVYRKCFVPNLYGHLFLREKCDFLPDMFNNPFWVDVTDEYTKTCDVNIPVFETKSKKTGFCYLCVFNKNYGSTWIPIDFTEIKKNQAIFHHIGLGGIYLPVFIDKDGFYAANVPFKLTNSGQVIFLKPQGIQTVKLFRKFSNDIFKIEHIKRMTGGVFQGANQSDFSDAIELYRIREYPGEYFNSIPVNVAKKFRYFRYLSPKNSFGNIAEIEFYEDNNNKPIKGKIIGTEGSYLNDPKCTKSAAFDGNVLTFFDSKTADYSWTGLDLGMAKQIKKIRFIARNDMNGIQKNNLYELFYWENGWKSAGQQTADTTFLIYKQVPCNTVFWLQNLTEGKEERIFTYENGKQVWW